MFKSLNWKNINKCVKISLDTEEYDKTKEAINKKIEIGQLLSVGISHNSGDSFIVSDFDVTILQKCSKKRANTRYTLSYLTLTYGARGRTRTGTVSLPGDFESPTSTNSITRALL